MFEQLKDTIKLTTDVYFNKILPSVADEKRAITIASYEEDIDKIVKHFYDAGFLNDDFRLTEEFLKGFHRSFYPDGYIQRRKDEKGKDFIWMIPGEYKHMKIISKDWVECTDHDDIPNWDPKREIYTAPADTKREMKKLVNNFNEKFPAMTDIKEKQDFVLFFMLDILYIHPFGDGNGRVYNILGDVLFLKIGIPPIGFMRLRDDNRLALHKALYMAHTMRDLKFVYDFIEKTRLERGNQ